MAIVLSPLVVNVNWACTTVGRVRSSRTDSSSLNEVFIAHSDSSGESCAHPFPMRVVLVLSGILTSFIFSYFHRPNPASERTSDLPP
jgi:hypothetical protein